MDFEKNLIAIKSDLERYAIYLTKNPHTAEDLLQETMLSAWDKKDTFIKEKSLLSWCFTIMTNKYIDDYRFSKTSNKTSSKYIINPKTNRIQEEGIDNYFNKLAHGTDIKQFEKPADYDFYKMELIIKNINRLDETSQNIINYVIKGFKTIEISEILGLSHGFVRYKLFKARIKLKDKF